MTGLCVTASLVRRSWISCSCFAVMRASSLRLASACCSLGSSYLPCSTLDPCHSLQTAMTAAMQRATCIAIEGSLRPGRCPPLVAHGCGGVLCSQLQASAAAKLSISTQMAGHALPCQMMRPPLRLTSVLASLSALMRSRSRDRREYAADGLPQLLYDYCLFKQAEHTCERLLAHQTLRLAV